MRIIVSEDLNSSPRGRMRFCATIEGDDRGGFGASERAALWGLAKAIGIHPATIQATATIERISVR